MKHVKFKPDFSGWSLESLDDVSRSIEQGLLKAMAEAISLAMEDDQTYMYFPAAWGGSDGIGGREVEDPLTIYLRMGLESGGEKPTYQFNLRNALEGDIERVAEGYTSIRVKRIADALRSLADELDPDTIQA